TEIAAPVALDPPHERHARIGLLPGDPDVGIAFVVLEADVIGGLVLPDERRLEMQRVPLRIHGDEVEIPDVRDEGDLPGTDEVGTLEVRPDPLVEALGLADVEHPSAGSLEHVDAREHGKGRYLAHQLFRVGFCGGLEAGIARSFSKTRGHRGSITRPAPGSGVDRAGISRYL